MKRWLWWLLLPILLAAWSLLVLAGWLPPLSAQQRQDLALLSAPLPPVEGSNAFAALWLAGFEVPPERRPELLQLPDDALPRALQASYPRRELDAEPILRLCRDPSLACLPALRAERESVAAGLDRLHGLESDRAELLTHGHYRDPRHGFTDEEISPLMVLLAWSHLASAFEVAEGRPMDALHRLCTDTAAWRRLRSGANSLVFDMLMLRQLRLSLALFGETLLELDPATPLPPRCAAAFAPLADAEFDQCPSMQREYRLFESTLLESIGRGPDASWKQRLSGRLINLPHALAMMAEPQARLCRDEHRDRIAAREPMPAGQAPSGCGLAGRMFNPTGCILGQLAPADNSRYYLRLLDVDRGLRLAGLGLWLRSQDQPVAQALAQRPTAFADIEARIEVDDDGASRLRIDPHDPSAAGTLTWPLTVAKPNAVEIGLSGH